MILIPLYVIVALVVVAAVVVFGCVIYAAGVGAAFFPGLARDIREAIKRSPRP